MVDSERPAARRTRAFGAHARAGGAVWPYCKLAERGVAPVIHGGGAQ